MKKNMNKINRIIFLLLFLSLGYDRSGYSQSKIASQLYPGQILKTPVGSKIILESHRVLYWPQQGPVILKNSQGQELARADLSSPALQENKADNSELIESDLGSQGSKKSYLKGRKDPRGKAFREKANSQESEKNKTQNTESNVAGVRVIETLYPNQAKKLTFYWSSGIEEVHFDRRGSFLSASTAKKIGPFDYQLEQWMEGSYQRRFKQSQGEVRTTYDTHDNSIRLEFFNAQGQAVSRFSCLEICRKI